MLTEDRLWGYMADYNERFTDYGHEALQDEIFEQEMALSSKEDCIRSICTCCEDSMYYGEDHV